jgi:hypothetical protein
LARAGNGWPIGLRTCSACRRSQPLMEAGASLRS